MNVKTSFKEPFRAFKRKFQAINSIVMAGAVPLAIPRAGNMNLYCCGVKTGIDWLILNAILHGLFHADVMQLQNQKMVHYKGPMNYVPFS